MILIIQHFMLIQSCSFPLLTHSSSFFKLRRMPIIKGYSHGVNYDRYAYHVAFLREFYTILQNTERKSDDTNDLDNSMSRKLQTAMAKHDSKLGERTRKSSKKKEAKFEEQIPSSIHNGNAWDTISKKLNMKKERRLSF